MALEHIPDPCGGDRIPRTQFVRPDPAKYYEDKARGLAQTLHEFVIVLLSRINLR